MPVSPSMVSICIEQRTMVGIDDMFGRDTRMS